METQLWSGGIVMEIYCFLNDFSASRIILSISFWASRTALSISDFSLSFIRFIDASSALTIPTL
jgi:hypothetical protein